MSGVAPRFPLLRQPGSPDPVRVDVFEALAFRRVGQLSVGTELLGGLWRPLRDAGVTSGKAELVGGTLRRVHYCVPSECTDGTRAATFSDSRYADDVTLAIASVTLGLREGLPWLHCHAMWTEPDGSVRAGHVWPDTVVGIDPPTAIIDLVAGVAIVAEPDAETNLPVFHHRREERGAMAAAGQTQSAHRVIIGRVKPNEDIVQTVEKICLAKGVQDALVRASVGSLTGARLLVRGRVVEAALPAVEVVALLGRVGPDERGLPRAELTATLVDKTGTVYAGLLVPGSNPVAITYELYLEPILADDQRA